MVGYNIFPIGFSTYEKSTIETFFRLAGRRAPHWAMTTRSSEARVVLVNATSSQDMENFRSLVAPWQKGIVVGSSDYGTGWPVLPRPIKLTAVLTLLEDVVNFKTSDFKTSNIPQSVQTVVAETVADTCKPTAPKLAIAKTANGPATHVKAVSLVLPVALSKVEKLAASTPAATFEKPSMTDEFASITTQDKPDAKTRPTPIVKPTLVFTKPTPTPKLELIAFKEAPRMVENNSIFYQAVNANFMGSTAEVGSVLLVDDSDTALRYMQNRLRHFSYECDMVRSGEEALAMVSTHHYKFVFLDVMMAGLDGYQTCKAIKNNKARRGPSPFVVMLTSKGGAIDKIRGSMAGCDAYLTKPLNDKKLAAVLGKYGASTVAERDESANPGQTLADLYTFRG
jgi:CheY-like chemotaxis protein